MKKFVLASGYPCFFYGNDDPLKDDKVGMWKNSNEPYGNPNGWPCMRLNFPDYEKLGNKKYKLVLMEIS